MKNKYVLNGVEIMKDNYEWYKLLTKGEEDLENLFKIIMEEAKFIGSAIIRFRKFIMENRNINFDATIEACRNKNIVDCKEILEELFLEQIDIEEVAAKMDRQGWSLESLILEHKRQQDKRIHRILNIPYNSYMRL